MFDLERFIQVQKTTHGIAARELQEGCKQSHWMWYTFPQCEGLGYSMMAQKYAITSLDEAKAYLDNDMLNKNIRHLCKILLSHSNISAHEIFGFPDDLKLQSSMTLFDLVSPNDIFSSVLDKYYDGERCRQTLDFAKK